ncbi:PAS domain-containing protein [Pseudoxanthomonas sp. J35]|uniref:PAS domain-containing protein n=1 Tax=Pseudoxanthomonas sp. J35 TaxID=935852 RepID=UPI0009FEE90A
MNAYVAADRDALNASMASLRESQALLSEAHELAQLGRWELQLPNGALACCERAREMLCTEPDVGCGGYDHLRRWVHPLDRPDVDAAFHAALANDTAYDIRYRVERPGHPPRMLRERGRALNDADGNRTRVVGTVQTAPRGRVRRGCAAVRRPGSRGTGASRLPRARRSPPDPVRRRAGTPPPRR